MITLGIFLPDDVNENAERVAAMFAEERERNLGAAPDEVWQVDEDGNRLKILWTKPKPADCKPS